MDTSTESTNSPLQSRIRKQKTLFNRHFTTPSVSPYASINWETRGALITNDKGEAIFEQKGIETPDFWSPMATNVVASKYFRGELGTSERETSIRDLINRVVSTIKAWGIQAKYFKQNEDSEIFEAELTYLLVHQYAAFNSPVWFNVGVHEKPQCSACFIVSVEDNIESLLQLQSIEGKLFKYGSGTGSNLSAIRSSKEKLSGGGKPSGPVSFMKGFDAWASIIKSGGKTRRAAKMQILNSNHPDIEEFINCKCTEEKKAWALIEQGYDGGFASPGGAYDSVAFQNANLSVRADDEFMRAVVENKEYWTKKVTDGSPCQKVNARDIMRQIAEASYLCGDPGMQFDDHINSWHTCPVSGRINASNPCSEYMHLDDSACNLSSLNLLKFFKDDGTFDIESFSHAIDILICAQDILVGASSYPTPKIDDCAKRFRQLGLGYANLGAALMCHGYAYDSDEGRALAANITALMSGRAYFMSAKLAQRLGAFDGFAMNRDPMLRIIERHLKCCEALREDASGLKMSATAFWRAALDLGQEAGFRNSQVSVLAPTGTIAFMMDCDTTGIEPDIALVKYKKLVGGGFLKLVNASVPRALRKLGYSEDEVKKIVTFVDQHETIEGAPYLKPEHLSVFDCAFKSTQGSRFIEYRGHLRMMAAVQPFISGAISKTVNLPKEVTAEDIEKVYIEAWQSGIKAVALYRDGSKRTQPLSTSKDIAKATPQEPAPARRRLPDERAAITHKFKVGNLEGYLTVGLYEDGSPGEIFIVVAKEGSTLSGMMDAFATAISLSLQYGVPLAALVRKFSFMRFEPAGFTGNRDIPSAQSVIDYIARWLALKFLTTEQVLALGLKPAANGMPSASKPTSNANLKHVDISQALVTSFQNSEDAPPCTGCGSNLMVRQAGCYVCLNCGAQGGCG